MLEDQLEGGAVGPEDGADVPEDQPQPQAVHGQNEVDEGEPADPLHDALDDDVDGDQSSDTLPITSPIHSEDEDELPDIPDPDHQQNISENDAISRSDANNGPRNRSTWIGLGPLRVQDLMLQECNIHCIGLFDTLKFFINKPPCEYCI